MFIELNNYMYQFFYSFIDAHWHRSDSLLGSEINEKLLSADAWVCVFFVYCMSFLILKLPIGFILERYWSKVLGDYIRDRGKKDNNKIPYKSFNFLEQFDKFQSNR